MKHAIIAFILALGASACAGPPYQPARDEGTVTTDASPKLIRGHDTFEGARGLRLYEQWWKPAAPARAVLVVVHGLKDHSGRYAELAESLVDRGFAVYALDLRGHAHSEGARVYVDTFDDYLDDLDVFLKRVEAREPNEPVFLFGHSMGGAIVTLYTITRSPKLSGLALSGAALEADVSWIKSFGTSVTAALAPRAGVFQLDLDLFSRDEAVVRACKADPLVYQPAAPARTAKELLGAIARIDEHMEDVTVPLLVMHGSADRVTPPQGSRELDRRARSSDKTLKIYAGLFHDLLHEPEKGVVLRDLVEWLDARAGKGTAPP